MLTECPSSSALKIPDVFQVTLLVQRQVKLEFCQWDIFVGEVGTGSVFITMHLFHVIDKQLFLFGAKDFNTL